MTNAKKAYENKTLRKIDQSQLAHSNNAVDMLDLAEDIVPRSFVKSRGTNLTLNEPFVKHNAEPVVESEMTRYSRDKTAQQKKLMRD